MSTINFRGVFAALVGGLVVYEVAALWRQKPGDTISEIIWQHADRRTIIPFSAGLLMGHFFWPRHDH